MPVGKGMKDFLNSSFDYQVQGFLGGGQVGYNQQVGNLVFGIEADASWGNIKGDQTLAVGGALAGATQTGVVGTPIEDWRFRALAGLRAAWAHERHDLAIAWTDRPRRYPNGN